MLATTTCLDRYWADELGCHPDDLLRDRVTVVAPAHRATPRWMGWQVPLDCIVRVGSTADSGVISVIPPLGEHLCNFLDPQRPGRCYLPPRGQELTPFINRHLPYSAPKYHCILHCDTLNFCPHRPTYPVEELHADDIHYSWYRHHFDGQIFVARDERGRIISWSAIKLKSAQVWEMAVVTEEPYRGMGLAKSVVSAATRATLAAGKTPIYLHDITNTASARVCRALGYQLYGHQLICENGRVDPSQANGERVGCCGKR